MYAAGVSFINSSIIGSTALQATTAFDGGPAALVIAATQFGTSVQLQFQAANQQWINVASAFVASQMYSLNAPTGQYRLVSAGSSINMSAALVRIPV